MPYTCIPKENHAKAFGSNLKISPKNAAIICRVIRGKKLKVAKKLLNDLLDKKRALDGKYYTNATKEIKKLLESCEKNADFMGLDAKNLFVHASATHGSLIRRRRRKAAFGSRMKMANVEIILIERGTSTKKKETKKESSIKEKIKEEINKKKKEKKEHKKEKVAKKEEKEIKEEKAEHENKEESKEDKI